MTSVLVVRTSAQKLTGSVNTSGEHTVLAADPALAYTCPTGKRASVEVTALITLLAVDENLRIRVGGVLVYQEGIGETIDANPPKYIQLGTFHLAAGETVTCTTSNSGTEGGKIRLNASVLSEIPA